jgi:hypothetical protein
MMQALMTFLISNANISSTEIYPHVVPLGQPLPAASVSLDGVERTRAFDGLVRIYECDFQIDTWAKTQAQADTLATEITNELESYTGDMSGKRIKQIHIEGESTRFDRSTELYSHSIFLTIWHK